jgi:hypothetical protein
MKKSQVILGQDSQDFQNVLPQIKCGCLVPILYRERPTLPSLHSVGTVP